jgi:hypothetical protein
MPPKMQAVHMNLLSMLLAGKGVVSMKPLLTVLNHAPEHHMPTTLNQLGRNLLTWLCTLDSCGMMGFLTKGGEMLDGTAVNVIGGEMMCN